MISVQVQCIHVETMCQENVPTFSMAWKIWSTTTWEICIWKFQEHYLWHLCRKFSQNALLELAVFWILELRGMVRVDSESAPIFVEHMLLPRFLKTLLKKVVTAYSWQGSRPCLKFDPSMNQVNAHPGYVMKIQPGSRRCILSQIVTGQSTETQNLSITALQSLIFHFIMGILWLMTVNTFCG